MDKIKELKSYLPEFLVSQEPLKSIYEAEGKILNELSLSLDDSLNQYFVDTATWGLEAWEKFVGIPTDKNKSLDDRRGLIKTKLIGQGKVTTNYIEEIFRAYPNGEVDVVEDFTDNVIKIHFKSLIGVPDNLNTFISSLEEVFPSHLPYKFQFQFLTIAMVEAMTLEELEQQTLDKFEH
jgi:hypothetical protein